MANVTRREFVTTSAAAAVATSTGAVRRPIIHKGKAGGRGLAIVHTNDTHGHDVLGGESMGLATVAAVRDSLQEQGYEVLVLDAGDALQGDTFANHYKGSSVIDLMNEVGYHAMAVGNHDFDFGQEVLQERIAQATFPVLSANVVYEGTGEPVFEANTILTLRDGMKVGVFGLTTPETKTTTQKKNTEGLGFLAGEELYACAQEQVDLLRAQGASLVVMLAHLGEGKTNASNRAADVVAHVRGVDIVIDGHDHNEEQVVLADASGADVLVVETGCYTHAVGFITYEGGRLASTLLKPDTFQGEDAVVAAMAAAYQKEVDEANKVSLATTDYYLSGKRKPGVRDHETNLADLVCDALLWAAQTSGETNACCAIVGGGGIRDSIEAGDITMNDVLNVLPFMNGISTVEVSGKDLLEAIEAGCQACPSELGGFPQVSGITYQVDTRVPYAEGDLYPNSIYHRPAKPGSRVTIEEVGGAPFDESATYKLATWEFWVTGGDTYYAFTRSHSVQSTGVLDSQALSEYLTEALGGVVSAEYADEGGQGRITIIE